VHARGGPHTAPRLVTHRDDDDTVPRDSSRASGFTSRQSVGASGDDGGGERRNRPRDCRRARNRVANARESRRALRSHAVAAAASANRGRDGAV